MGASGGDGGLVSVAQPLLGEKRQCLLSDWPALSSEMRSVSVVHLELGLFKGPKIARALKGELHERAQRDPSCSLPSRPLKSSTINPGFCSRSVLLLRFTCLPFSQLVLKTFPRRQPSPSALLCRDFHAVACMWGQRNSELLGNGRK